MISLCLEPARQELRWMLRQSRAPRLRTMREWAEAEIVIPDGRFKGHQFKCERQPFSGAWFDAVDRGIWEILIAQGPTQTGKTLDCAIIPLLYHLFEIGESVVFGVPDMDMADDKWQIDVLPVIRRTRYAHLLPTTGEGSRGGKVKNAVLFGNGSVCKFMTGGAGDNQRAGFTSRVLVVTEAEKFNVRAQASEETNKLGQLMGRTLHWGSLRRIYLECTVTTDEALLWHMFRQGTASELVKPCPYCGQWVMPGRDQLAGWQTAESEEEARLAASFACPACGHDYTAADRQRMNKAAVLLHRGQRIEVNNSGAEVNNSGAEGNNSSPPSIVGDPPATRTLGFHWSFFDNQFLEPADVAAQEWKAARANNEEDAERETCQFWWAVPYKSPHRDLVQLTYHGLTTRQGPWTSGLVPADTVLLTTGCDVGKWLLHWVTIAWRPEGRCHVVAYDTIEVPSDRIGEERAIELGLDQLRGICEMGWTWQDHPRARSADLIGIDSGYQDKVVHAFVRRMQADAATADRYWPSKGFGEGQIAGHSYCAPKKTGAVAVHVGEDYHFAALPAHGVHVLEFSADAWKSFFHNRLACDYSPKLDPPGALTLPAAIPKTHAKFCRHLTAEKAQQQYDPARGEVTHWIRLRKENHWLDGGVIASVLGHFGGMRVLAPPPPRPAPSGTSDPQLHTPDGRPFSILER